ncbi:hypothetical protein ASE52_10135 [Acidovorax sp. Root275]|uniref:hypothetical protein n=1 Tax=Acidovorax sp. Root275 TaxID=1736508 RepID=UPI00070AF254|nr:hypothetical protein [Acidovorax sp. Root275]KRD47780.1 hypothetical protein ASE52_10135 [Acidovorax sp. Root275]
MTAPSPEIAAFWRDFSDAQASLQAQPLRGRVESANALIERHLSGLALEMSGGDGDAVVDLIVTAHGSTENFPLLMQVVAAAPVLQSYRVRAFRERTTQPDFPIGMDGFELATSEVLVACGQDDGQAALEIRFGREIPEDYRDHARNMAFIMLDHVLGEYDFAVKVGAVDFVDEASDPLTPWVPLSQFVPVFDRYWFDTLGRTSDFPSGEHDWTGMTLSFGGQDDEDGHSDDAEDTAIVMVNRSANPVAMRADLAYALTLDLAVGNRDQLAAVQDLQDQAATLLELPQLGIMAYTLTRAGRRKAVYYVGDEQLAKQALAPLLLREEAESLELTFAFDPAWSGYFEFSVHCP